jgi:hypothetical protein
MSEFSFFYPENFQGHSYCEARKKCLMAGGDLIDIPNIEFEKELVNFLHPSTADYFWIGLHQVEEELAWKWTTGETLDSRSYKNWAENQPNDCCGTPPASVDFDIQIIGYGDCDEHSETKYEAYSGENCAANCANAGHWMASYNGSCYCEHNGEFDFECDSY